MQACESHDGARGYVLREMHEWVHANWQTLETVSKIYHLVAAAAEGCVDIAAVSAAEFEDLNSCNPRKHCSSTSSRRTD